MRNIMIRHRIDQRAPLHYFSDPQTVEEKKRRIEIYRKRAHQGAPLFEDKNGSKTY